MPKPKFVKPLLIGCACALPLGLVVGLSVNWDHRQFISSVGSSGVKPFVEAFGKRYTQANPKLDVQVESGGTTFAIEEVAKGLTNIGNASNNPYWTIQPETGIGYVDQWKNKKTFTLGFEGLVILYKMPDGLSKEAQQVFDIVISQDNILDLYAVFSGFNELKSGDWKEENGSIYHFLSDDAIASISALPTKEKDLEICKNTQITPFVRSGGNTAANSSIAFTYYSNLASFKDMTKNQQNAFNGGQYGDARPHFETEESNARAWEMFSKVNKPGSMVYLTTGFIANKHNQQAIKDAGYGLTGYLPKDATEAVYFSKEGDIDKICITNGYNWYRPINCMIDLAVQKSIDFIDWIYNQTFYSEVVRANGAKPLTTKQMNSMKGTDGKFYSSSASDLELAKTRTGTKYVDIYGAEDIWE